MVVVDDEGYVVDDVLLFDLFVIDDWKLIGDLIGLFWLVIVVVDVDMDEVVDKLIVNWGLLLLVVDVDDHLFGCIFIDDVVDVLAAICS